MSAASQIDSFCINWYDLDCMRTTVDISEPLLENAKKRAADLHVTVSVVLEDALRRHLATGTAAPKAVKFQLHTVRGKLVQPSLDLNRTSTLLTEDDEAAYSKERI